MMNYSFIIPHKNTPMLLARCVNSIPQRDDIEIVVVDDDSDDDKKPNFSRSDVKIVYIDSEKSKGAGRARNYGLEEATGKWLLFPDADDYYISNFIETIDKHKDDVADVIYFNVCGSSQYENRLRDYKKALISYDGSVACVERLKYFGVNALWVKMVRKAMVDNYNIRFEEIMHGNDIFFTYQIGYFAKSINVEKKPIYYYFCNPNSLTNENGSVSKDLIYLQHFLQIKEFRRFIGHKEWVLGHLIEFLRMIKRSGVIHTIRVYREFWRNRQNFMANKFLFVDTVKQCRTIGGENK